ncbi:hypothetical protein HY771_00160 [Candidatus Uhrbacteria bacterium]|nr:hypothetical protein [Candidatus Uhrbacteria bacterium]
MKLQNNSIFSIVFVLLVIVFLLGIGIYKGLFRYFIFSPDWDYKGLAVSTNDCTAQNLEIVELKNDCFVMYTHGWQSQGSFENDTYAFSSCDGLNWKKEGMVLKNASMPTAVKISNDRIRLYFAKWMADIEFILMKEE